MKGLPVAITSLYVMITSDAVTLPYRRARRVIDGVGRLWIDLVVRAFERIRGPGLRGNERGKLLRFLVRQAAGVEVGHRVTNHPREHIDARGTRAVVPRIVPPERCRPLVADEHAPAV